MNEKLRKLALTFVNYPVDPFAYKWVEIHFGLHPDFDADHVLFDEVHDFVRNLTDWNWPENQLEVEWLEVEAEAKHDCLWTWRDIEAEKAKDWARCNLPESAWRQILKQGKDGDQFYPDDEFGLFVVRHLNEPWAFDAVISGKQYSYPDYWPSLLNSLKYKQPIYKWL